MLKNQDRIADRQVVMLEAHGLLVRHILTTIPPLPEEEKPAAKIDGARRYELYREMLRQLLSENAQGFLGSLEDLVTGESQFFTHEELELLNKPAPARPAKEEAESE